VSFRLPLVLVLAATAASAACSSTGSVPRPFPTPGGRAPTADSRPSGTAAVDTYALTGTALALRGSPYLNGGSTPSGFDCSGFTQYVFAQHGIGLPRDVKEQFEMGKAVKADRIAAGDLVFFTTIAPGASHVGIALGGDEFVHAPSTRGVVRVERFSAAYWSRRFVGVRRVN
jgi:peptidoglycan DL-endopeptidase CwlO